MRPVRIEGEGRVERLVVERTRLDETGNAVGTGEEIVIPCGMVVSCIGYRTHPIPGIPYDDRLGRFVNEEGRIAPGLYCVRSEEHTSELQSLMRISYAVFC